MCVLKQCLFCVTSWISHMVDLTSASSSCACVASRLSASLSVTVRSVLEKEFWMPSLYATCSYSLK